jgi:hypothetical protein
VAEYVLEPELLNKTRGAMGDWPEVVALAQQHLEAVLYEMLVKRDPDDALIISIAIEAGREEGPDE